MSETVPTNGRTRKFLSELLRPLEHPPASAQQRASEASTVAVRRDVDAPASLMKTTHSATEEAVQKAVPSQTSEFADWSSDSQTTDTVTLEASTTDTVTFDAFDAHAESFAAPRDDWRGENPSAVMSEGIEAALLQRVLHHFHLPGDVIVCGVPGCDVEPESRQEIAFRIQSQGEQFRVDSLRTVGRLIRTQSNRPGSLLQGLLESRWRRRTSQRIIGFFEAEALQDWQPDEWETVDGSPSQLLLIVLNRGDSQLGQGESTRGHHGYELARRASSRGWTVRQAAIAELVSDSKLDWGPFCEQGRSTLLIVDAPASTTSSSTLSIAPQSTTGCSVTPGRLPDAVAQTPSPYPFLWQLVEQCLSDPGFMLVASRELLSSAGISSPYYEGVFSFRPAELEETLTWCEGFSAGGGEPVVVLTVLEAVPYTRMISRMLRSPRPACRFILVTPEPVDAATGLNFEAISEQLADEFSALGDATAPRMTHGSDVEHNRNSRANSRQAAKFGAASRSTPSHVPIVESVRYASADGSGLFLDDVVGKGGEGRRSLSRVTFIDAKGSTAVVSDALRESWSGSLVGSPELQKIDSQVRATPIPENLADWISRCAAAESRPEYLWRWCLYAVDLLTLPSVPREWRDEVLRLKVLLAMFNVLLDDLADLKSDPELLRELLQLASSSADDSATKGTRNVISQQVEASTTTGRHAGEEYRRLCFDVWDELTRSVQRLPRYAELKSAFQFDVSQLMTTIDYSQLLNGHPQLLNRADHDRFSPYGMMVMCAASIDLMVSTSVDAAEFGKIREVVAEGEWMARIGNLVSTWRRELPAGDITSGIFAEAVASGVITLSQLIDPTRSERNVRLIELAGIEQRYIRKWRQHRSRLHQLAESVTSCPLRLYAEAFDKLWMSEIASIGQK